MSYFGGEYDVAVIGAGHAGCEAALAAARLGMKTAIFSISLEAVANMPCNPHIGGSSKGHLVREIDALGGEMGKNIDKTMIQIKMLNTSKGPAVHSLRAQADRKRYQMEMKHTLEKQKNLDIKLVKSNLFEKVKGKYDVIISNPPYISYNEEIMDIVKNNEPNIALFADNEGLYYYEEILKSCKDYLNDEYLIAFEIGATQKDKIIALVNKYLPNSNIISKKDMQGRDRMIFIMNKK